jgi:hypothetical protein
VKDAVLQLPAGQTALSLPTDASLEFIAMGVGVQNYTCTAAGTYVTAGALAELYDVGCLYGNPAFDSIQDFGYILYAGTPPRTHIDGPNAGLALLGQHYFITNPTNASTISPVFDFSSSALKGDPNGKVVVKRLGGIPSPARPQNVDWLELGNQEGELAKYVFRVATKAGQPPATCQPGSEPISIKYSAKYWFFK